MTHFFLDVAVAPMYLMIGGGFLAILVAIALLTAATVLIVRQVKKSKKSTLPPCAPSRDEDLPR